MLAHESEDLSFISHNLQKTLGASHNTGETEIGGSSGLSGHQPSLRTPNSLKDTVSKKLRVIESHPKLTSGLSHKCR